MVLLWNKPWFSLQQTQCTQQAGTATQPGTAPLPGVRCPIAPAPAITELGSGKPRKTLRHLPSLRACTTPLPGDQVGARPCRLSSRCGGNAATAGASPREPGITAGSGAPAGSILLCTSSQSKGSRVPWCDLPRHGQVLSCSAPNQSRGRRFSTSPALHKPEAPQELPLEPPP